MAFSILYCQILKIRFISNRNLKLWGHFSKKREKKSPYNYIKNMIDEELDLQHCTFHEVGYSFEFSYYYVNFMENYFSSQ